MAANNDSASLYESTTSTPTSVTRDAGHGLLANDTGVTGGILSFKTGLPGIGGSNGTFGNSLRGNFGDLILNADGSYTYIANNANQLVQGQVTHEYFSYTVMGSNGQPTTALLDFSITGTNDAPVIFDPFGHTTIRLSEEGLAGGLADDSGTPDTTNSTRYSTEITIGDPDYCDNITLSIAPPAHLTSGGQPLVWVSLGNAIEGAVMVGRVGSANGPDALRISCDTGGHLEIQLLRPVDHPNANQEDVINTSFDIIATDQSGAHSSLSMQLRLEDDSPIAAPINQDVSGTATGNLFDGVHTAMGADGGGVAALMVGGILYDRSTPAFNAGTGVLRVTTSNGDIIALNLNTGAYEFTANPGNTSDRTANILYFLQDGDGDMASSNLAFNIKGGIPTNHSPVAVRDVNSITESTGSAETSVTGDVTTTAPGQDSDPDGDAFSVTGVAIGNSPSAPVGNVGTQLDGTYGRITLNANGTYSYRLDNARAATNGLGAGQTANEIITYTITDTHGAASSTTLTITITGTNDAPTAVADDAAVTDAMGTANTTISGDLTPALGAGRDSDPDSTDILTVTGIRAGTGTPGGGSTATSSFGTLSILADGSYTYVLNGTGPANNLGSGQTATDVFTYAISDGHGGTSATTLTIRITGSWNGINNRPTAVADIANVIEGTGATHATVTGDLTPTSGAGRDTDPDAGQVLTVTGIRAGSGVIGSSTTATGSYGTVIVSGDGSYTYVVDGTGAAQSLGVGRVVNDVFTYAISDGYGGTSATTLTIRITGTNDAPTAVADEASIREAGGASNATISGDLSPASGAGRDLDPDNGDVLTVTGISAGLATPGNAMTTSSSFGRLTVNALGSYTYVLTGTGAAQQLGLGVTATDVFTYTINDGHGGTSATTLTIRITGTNDAPTAVADYNSITEGLNGNVSVTGDVTSASGAGRDYDPDATDVLTVTGIGRGVGTPGNSLSANGTYGAISIASDGSYSYTLNSTGAAHSLAQGQTATEVFSYTINDGHGGISTTTLTIRISGDGTAADRLGVYEDSSGGGNVLTNDHGTGLTVVNVNGTSGNVGHLMTGTYGHMQINADGSYNYAADTRSADALRVGHTAQETFTYRVRDANGQLENNTVTVVITGVNDDPLGQNHTFIVGRTQQHGLSMQDILVGASDVDNGKAGIVAFEVIDPPAASSFFHKTNTGFYFDPIGGRNLPKGDFDFTYVLIDADGGRSPVYKMTCTQIVSSPLVLDLDGDGVQSVGVDAGVFFDIDAEGVQRNTGWAEKDDGFLVRDINGDGVIDSGSELFGTSTADGKGGTTENGFQALALLDSNQDGLFDTRDIAWQDVKVWRDGNMNGLSEANEMLTLDQLKIASLNLGYERSDLVQNGNHHLLQGSYQTTDGATHELTDVFFENTSVTGTQAVASKGAEAMATGLAEDASTTVWKLGQESASQIVKGFDQQHDILDLRDLLGDQSKNNLDNLLSVHSEGNNTLVQVKDNAGKDHNVVLVAVDLLAGTTEDALIHELLRKSHLE